VFVFLCRRGPVRRFHRRLVHLPGCGDRYCDEKIFDEESRVFRAVTGVIGRLSSSLPELTCDSVRPIWSFWV
jgi:hypothetical protein